MATSDSRWIYASYDKIAESPRQWRLDEAGERQLGRLDWVVTEKIHGANFCLLSDGAALACASRRELLAPEASFFGFQKLRDELAPQIHQIVALLRERDARVQQAA